MPDTRNEPSGRADSGEWAALVIVLGLVAMIGGFIALSLSLLRP